MKLSPVLLFLAGARAAVVKNQAGGFMGSCEKVAVGEHEVPGATSPQPWYLTAVCGPNSQPASIKIDDCVGNDNGRLVWQKSGRFSESCTSCVTNSSGSSDAPRGPGVYLQCRCKNPSGGAPEVGAYSFNLNSKITYTPSGTLTCPI